MNYKYEMACKEAGMREEDIQALRREFDADYKRLSRENKRKDKLGFSSVSLSRISRHYAESLTLITNVLAEKIREKIS